MCLGWGSSLKSSSCKQHCWALIISRFVFVVFAFPVFPLPYPLSKNCLLLFTYIPSPCGGTHFRGQQQWRNHSARPVVSGKLSCSLQHCISVTARGGFLSSHRLFRPWILPGATKRCHVCWHLWWCVAAHIRTHMPTIISDSFSRHTCTEEEGIS